MINIIKYIDEKNKKFRLEQIKEIFYEASSVKSFRDDNHKEEFFNKWCGDYITNCSEEFLLMVDDQDDFLYGYLSGMNDSNWALEYMRVPGLKIFSDLFIEYPAHIHINFHAKARGKGLGSKLMQAYFEELISKNIKGVHLVTSPNAQNVTFYERLGFDHKIIREQNGQQLLFMGKPLP